LLVTSNLIGQIKQLVNLNSSLVQSKRAYNQVLDKKVGTIEQVAVFKRSSTHIELSLNSLIESA